MGARASRSFSLILVALGVLFAQVPMLLHLALVPHRMCEHGELVDGVAARAEGSETGVGPSSQVDRRAQRHEDAVDRGYGDGRDHDHCDALAVRHRVPEMGTAVPDATVAWIALAPTSGEREEARQVPLLSLAPKSSPPA